MFCSVKTDEGNDASASSLSHVTQHTFACPLRHVPIRSMKHALVANKKRLVQESKNAVAYSRLVTKNLEYENVFLPFIFDAYECCMTKLMCVRYKKLLRASNIRTKFCIPGLVTRF